MVVPAVSYATAEKTCSCHLNSADHQCHCEEGCKSCGMHNHAAHSGSGIQSETDSRPESNSEPHSELKSMTCSMSPNGDNAVLPILAAPFMVPDFSGAVPNVNVSNLSNLTENPVYGVTITPSEKPPQA